MKSNYLLKKQFLENITATAADDKFYLPRLFVEITAIVAAGLVIALAFALAK